MSPRLLELNSAGALNGHVPITAIVSLIVVAAGYVYGYDTTLVALERSADEATSLVGGVAVNHQWSKSTECELGLAVGGPRIGVAFDRVRLALALVRRARDRPLVRRSWCLPRRVPQL